ncbi:hypothetical protein QOT17_010051 [Balamuthia mandrillaris]
MMSWRGGRAVGGCRPALWTFFVMGSNGGVVGPVQQSSCLLARAPSTSPRIALHSWQVSRSVRQMHASSSLLFSAAEGTTHPASREAHDPSTRRRRRGKGVVLSRTEKKELYSTPRSHSSNKGASAKQQEREEEDEVVAKDKEEHNQEDNNDDDETKELITLWQEYARHKEKWPLIFSYLQGLQTEMERAERRGTVEEEEDKRPSRRKQRKRPLPPIFLVNLVLQQMVGRKNDLRAGVELVKQAKACGVPLSAATFSLLISAYGKAGQMGAIQRALQVMEEEGVPLNAFVYSALISAYAHAKDSETAARYFVEMKQQGMRPDVVTYSALLNAFIEGQQLGQAESLLYDMKTEAEKNDDDNNETNQTKKKKKKQKTFRFDAHVYSLMRKLVARLRLEGEEERANDLIVDFDIRERSNNTTSVSVEEEAQQHEQGDEQEQREQETGESENEKRE